MALTQAKVAEHLGFTDTRRVRELLERETIPPLGNMTLAEVRVSYIRHLQEQAAGRAGEGVDELQEARIRKAKADAEVAELEAKLRVGDVAPLSDQESVAAMTGAFVARRMLAVAAQVKNELEGVSAAEAATLSPKCRPCSANYESRSSRSGSP